MTSTRTRLVYGDRWTGVHNDEWEIDEATLEEFDQALDRLDARTYTMVTIQGDGEAHFSVGGGGGRYVAYATFDNEEFWSLLHPESSGGVILLNAGGQEGDYPAREVVSLEQARAAGRVFFLQQSLDPAQQWAKK